MNTGLKVFYIPFEVPFNHRSTASQKAQNHFQANWPQGLASTGLYTHKGLSVFYMPFGLPVNQRPTASQKPLAPHFAYWPQDFLHAIWGVSKSQAHCLSKSLFGVPVNPMPTAFKKHGPSSYILALGSSTCHLGSWSITGLLSLKKPRGPPHAYWPQGLLHVIWGAS